MFRVNVITITGPGTLIDSYVDRNNIKVTKCEANVDYSYIESKIFALVTKIHTYDGNFDVFLSYILIYIMPISLIISFISLILAANDRYFALAFPFAYREAKTIKIAKIALGLVWILSIAVYVFVVEVGMDQQMLMSVFLQPLFISPLEEFEFKQGLSHYFITVLLIVLFVLLWIMTSLTLRNLYKSYKRSMKLNRKIKKKLAPEKQMAIVLIFMVIAFTLSLTPTLYNNIHHFDTKKESLEEFLESTEMFYISILFMLTNSIWNILIYNVLNKKFRLSLKAFLKDLFKKFYLSNDKKEALRKLNPRTWCTKKLFSYRIMYQTDAV